MIHFTIVYSAPFGIDADIESAIDSLLDSFGGDSLGSGCFLGPQPQRDMELAFPMDSDAQAIADRLQAIGVEIMRQWIDEDESE